MKLWLKNSQHLSKHTIRTYKWGMETYIKMKGNITGMSEDGKANVRRSARACINFGIKKGYNVKKHMPEGNFRSTPRERIATKEELDKLLSTTGLFGDYMRFIVYTGARRSEACSVLLSNYNREEGYVSVWGKSGHRLLRVTEQASEFIRDFNISPGVCSHLMIEVRSKLNITDLTLHDLRRTFGTNYLINGGTMAELSVLLGHDSITTTERHYAFLKVRNIKDFKL
tara:strand:+ start:12050 stop:12730 length:681 start_codon:yes stop_codon:yes gene_type:complete